jgi:hypothetical protein
MHSVPEAERAILAGILLTIAAVFIEVVKSIPQRTRPAFVKKKREWWEYDWTPKKRVAKGRYFPSIDEAQN